MVLFGLAFWAVFLVLRSQSSRAPHIGQAVQQLIANPVEFATNNFKGGIGAALFIDPSSGLPTVNGVISGTPAEAAGLQKGDIILKINDSPALGKSLVQVVDQLRGFTVGSVQILIQRDGTNHTCVMSRVSWNKLRELGHFN
jgi:carboxyl-terminal processing protease